jgi:hypothetical protein
MALRAELDRTPREAPHWASPWSSGAPQRRGWLVSESLIRVTVGWPGSWQAVWSGNRLDRSPATKATSGGRATRWAVTRVKSEQASKGKLWTPTRPEIGEGSTVLGSSRQMHLGRSIGVMDTARRDSQPGNWGRPAYGEGSGLNGAARACPWTCSGGAGRCGSRTGS